MRNLDFSHLYSNAVGLADGPRAEARSDQEDLGGGSKSGMTTAQSRLPWPVSSQ